MSHKKAHKTTKTQEKILNTVQQNRKGIRADDIAKKLHINRSTVYRHFEHLQLAGKVENKGGLWFSTEEEQRIEALEKEITVEFPPPKNQRAQIAFINAYAEKLEREGFDEWAAQAKSFTEKLKETRTIKIKGKNVDDLTLQKIAKLTEQANEISSKFNLKSLFKNLKR